MSTNLGGSGNTFTGEETFRLHNFSGNTDDLWNGAYTVTNANAYIGLSGNISTATLNTTPEYITNGYHVKENVTVVAENTLTLADGVNLKLDWDRHVNVSGLLQAHYSTVANAISSTQNWGGVGVNSGGVLDFENANITLTGNWGRVSVWNGGTLTMKNGILSSNSGGVYVDTSGILNLEGTNVSGYINGNGIKNLSSLSVSNYISGNGNLTLDSVTVGGYVSVGGSAEFTATDCTINGYVSLADGVTADIKDSTLASYLQVANMSTNLGGSGNTFTGEETFRLNNFTGNTDDLWSNGAYRVDCTTEGATPYIGLGGTIYTTTINAAPEYITGGYRVKVSLTVAEDNTLTLAEGIDLEYDYDKSVSVYGALQAHYETAADALSSTQNYARLYVQSGGVVDFENANINLNGSRSEIVVQNGGMLTMKGGLLNTNYWGVGVNAGGVLNLDGTEVDSYISGQGNINLKDLNVSSYVISTGSSSGLVADGVTFSGTVRADHSIDLTNCTLKSTLTIAKSATHAVVTGCDLSEASITLSGSGSCIIDLSGNYWGTTDINEIEAKIKNYSMENVIISYILTTAPEKQFSYAADMVMLNKVGNTTGAITLNFNHEIDASTVPAGIQLLDSAGNVVTLSGYEVNGKQLTLKFDNIADGRYKVLANENLKSTGGESFCAPEAMAGGVYYDIEPLVEPSVLLVRCNSTVTDQFSFFELYFDQLLQEGCLNVNSVGIRDSNGNELVIKQVMQGRSAGGAAYCRVYFDTATERGDYTIHLDSTVAGVSGNAMVNGYEYEVYVASPDLTVTELVDCSTTLLGREATISYSVSNVGDGEIKGDWVDTIYLCKSETWDASQAIVLGRVSHKAETVAEGASYSSQLKVLLDDVIPGDYYVFVDANSGDIVNEISHENNISATGTKLELSVIELGGDAGMESTDSTVSANEKLYYSFTATESGTYGFSLNMTGGKLSAAEGTYPGTGTSIGKVFTSDNQKELYFEAEAGKTYYVLAEPGKRGEYAASIEQKHFSLISSPLSTIAAGRDVTFRLYGTCFSEATEFYLQDADGNIYQPTSIQLNSAVNATLSFRLPEELEPGKSLTLYATDPAVSEPIALEQPLSVATYADSVDISFSNMNGESHTGRVGWVWKADLSVTNKAGYDVENAIILVTDTADDFSMYYSYEDAKVRDRSALLLCYGNADATKGTLSAGESEKLGVYVRNYRSGTGAIQAWLLSPDDDTVITEERWAQLESALRPAACSDAEWTAWWSDMKPRIGTTVADFVSFVQGMQAHVVGEDDAELGSTLPQLVEQVMNSNTQYLPGYVVKGTLRHSETGEVLAGQEISIYEIDSSGELVLFEESVTDSSGAYTFYGMEQGKTYVLSTDGMWDMNQDGWQDETSPSFTVDGGDVLLDGYGKPYADLTYNENTSSYSYLAGTDGTCYRLWNKGGNTAFAFRVGEGQWQELILNDTFDSSLQMIWSDTFQAVVVSRMTADGPVYRIGKVSGNSMIWSEEQGLSLEAESSLLGVREMGDGNLLFICEDKLTDEIHLLQQPLPDVSQVAQWSTLPGTTVDESVSGLIEPYDKEFTFAPPKGFISKVMEWFGFSGKLQLHAEVADSLSSASYSATASGNAHVSSVRSYDSARVDFDIRVSVAGGASIDAADCPVEVEFSEPVLSYSLSFGLSSRLGLINALKLIPIPGAAALSSLLKWTNSWLKKKGATMYAGYSVNFSFSGSSDSSKIEGSTSMILNLGVESKEGGWVVRFDPTVTLSYSLDTKTWNFDFTDLDFTGNVTIKTPSFWGYYIGYEGPIGEITTVSNWTIEEAEDKRSASSVGESIISKSGDVIQVYEHYVIVNDLSASTAQKITYSFGDDFETSDVSALSYGEDSLLLAGTGISSSLEVTAGEGLTAAQIDEFMLTCTQGTRMEFVSIEVENGESTTIGTQKLIYQNESTSGIGTELQYENSEVVDITTGIQDISVYEFNSQVYMAWITIASGKSQLFVAQLAGDEWNSPTLVCESEQELSQCILSEEDGCLIVMTEAPYEDDLGTCTEHFVMSESGVWTQFSAHSTEQDLESETGAISLKPSKWVETLEQVIKNAVISHVKCEGQEEEPEVELPHEEFSSFDPNEIYGPQGVGTANWIAPAEMDFQIACENIAKDNIAHAAMVTITQQLDEALDWSTFTLGTMMLGGQYIDVAEGLSSYNGRIDMTSTLGVWVDIEAGVDLDTGLVTWSFIAIDPETGYVVSDPFTGLLAPNYNPPEGDGFVNYSIKPRDTVASGTAFKAEAEIIFDFNEPIDTPVLNYTIDATAPDAEVLALPETGSGRYIRVNWSGDDEHSGVASYDVYVSVDGGDWELWRGGIAATSALYAAQNGEHTYAFFATATDRVGNMEAVGEMEAAEAGTQHNYSSTPLSATAEAQLINSTLTLAISFSHAPDGTTGWGSAEGPAWAELITVPGVELAAGSFSYDADTNILSWTGEVNPDTLPGSLEVQVAGGAIVDAAGNALAPVSLSVAEDETHALEPADDATYAAPTWADANGDGLADLLVGVKTAEAKGAVRIYLNTEAGLASTFDYAKLEDGTTLTVDAEGCQGAIVRLYDLNGDGSQELIIGLSDGSVVYYSASTTVEGAWVAAGALTCLVLDEAAAVKVSSRAAIDFADLDGDGSTDLLVGTGEGYVVWYRGNISGQFMEGAYLYDAHGLIQAGQRASVSAEDVDGDGLVDLLVGSSTGQVYYYRNLGEAGTPLFGEAVLVAGINVAELSDRLRLDAADVNGDGQLDIVAGLSDGSVKVSLGSGNNASLGSVKVQTEAAPDAPENLVATTAAGGVTSFSWNAVEGASRYVLTYCVDGGEKQEVSVSTPAGGESVSLTLTLSDGTHSWSVRSVSALGVVSLVSEGNAITVDATAPDVPEISSPATVEDGKVSMSWAAVADSSGVSYELRYKAEDAEDWTSVRTDSPSLTLPGELAGGLYAWQLRAVDGLGNASVWSAEQSFVVEGSAPEFSSVWVRGIVLNADGSIASGYSDVNKLGNGDSNLCWAAVAGNMLAWWQGYYGTVDALGTTLPTDAADIYASFVQNWENASGLASNGCIWWLSGRADDSSYSYYYDQHYTGSADAGGYYSQYYSPATVAQAVVTTSVSGFSAAELADLLADGFRQGGISALNIYSTRSSSGFSGGHALTLWGITREAESGTLTTIHVTDSDDGKDAVLTLDVVYDAASGCYRIAENSGRLSGYYIGSCTTLGSFAAPEPALLEPEVEPGSAGRSEVTFSWMLPEGSAAGTFKLAGKTIKAKDIRYDEASGIYSYSTTLKDGAHEYSLTATDEAGKSEELSATLVLDTKAPKLSLKKPKFSKVAEGRVSVLLSWSGEAGALYSVTLEGDEEPAYMGYDTQCVLELPLDTAGKRYTITATDAAGNLTSTEQTHKYALLSHDATAPELSDLRAEVDPESLSKGKGTVSFSWAGEEGATYTLMVDGKKVYSGTATTRSVSLADGEHSYSVIAKDKAGNSSELEGGTFTFDATAPTVTLDTPELREGRVTLRWTADADTTSYTVRVWKGTTEIALENGGVTETSEITFDAPAGPGTYSYSITATDGTNTSAEKKGSFTLPSSGSSDTAAPAVSALTHSVKAGKNGMLSVTLSWAGEKGATYTLKVDDAIVYVGSATKHTLTLDGSEPHRYSLIATDKAGNRGDEVTGVFDYSALTVSHELESVTETSGKKTTTTTTATLHWTAEAGVDYVLKVGGKEVAHDGAGYEWTGLKDGKQSYTLTATDKDGNTITYSGSFVTDTKAPKLTLSKPKLSEGAGGTVDATLSWKGEKGATYTLTVDGRAVELSDPTASSQLIRSLSDGEHSYSVIATDAAGNVSEAATGSFFYDTTAPDIILDVITGEASTSKGITRTTATLSWAGEDGVSYTVLVDGKKVSVRKLTANKVTQSTLSATTGKLTAGAHSYSIIAKDKAGNLSTYSGVFRCDGSGGVIMEGAEPLTALPEGTQALDWYGWDTAGFSSDATPTGAARGYSFELTEARQLDVKLSGLAEDAAVVLQKAGARESITLKANAGSQLDRELTLSAGTYYLQVLGAEGTSALASSYMLDLELEKNGKKSPFGQAVLASA